MAIFGFCILIVIGVWWLAMSFWLFALSAFWDCSIVDYIIIILPLLIGVAFIGGAVYSSPFYFGVN